MKRPVIEKSFINTLAAEKGAQDVDPNSMNKSEASTTINDLKNKETQNPGATAGEPIQNPDSWSTGDDKATGKQYASTLNQLISDLVS